MRSDYCFAKAAEKDSTKRFGTQKREAKMSDKTESGKSDVSESEPMKTCPRCYTRLEEGFLHCWVCYENSKEVVYVADLVPPEQHPGWSEYRPQTSVAGTVAKSLLIGLSIGLGSLFLSIFIALLIIGSFLSALADICSPR